MKPAGNFQTVMEGLWFWSALHEEWQVEFSSCAWKAKDALVLIDPIELNPAGLAKLEQVGPPSAILLTGQNHERHADWFRAQYGIKVHVHRDAIPGIEIKPDEFFCDGVAVPGGLKVVHVPGVSSSECAFYTAESAGVLLSGDVFMNGASGLAFLPDDYCQDAKQNRESARKLLDLQFDTLTVGHGKPLRPKAREQVVKLFNS